jgi:hypothetical protein
MTFRICVIFSGEEWAGPRIIKTGSPGRIRVRINMITKAPKTVGIVERRRLRMYCQRFIEIAKKSPHPPYCKGGRGGIRESFFYVNGPNMELVIRVEAVTLDLFVHCRVEHRLIDIDPQGLLARILLNFF